LQRVTCYATPAESWKYFAAGIRFKNIYDNAANMSTNPWNAQACKGSIMDAVINHIAFAKSLRILAQYAHDDT
jgi:hypothetical protein